MDQSRANPEDDVVFLGLIEAKALQLGNAVHFRRRYHGCITAGDASSMATTNSCNCGERFSTDERGTMVNRPRRMRLIHPLL